jgi:hypothetical protein
MSKNSIPSPIFHLKLNLRVSLSAGRNTVRIENLSEQIGLGLTAEPVHPYDFYVGAWMGCDNPHMQFEMLKGSADGTGVASLSIPILAGDTDVFKVGCYIKDPDTHMNRHIASGFHSLAWLADAIDGVSSFDHAKTSLLLNDNYSKNKVVLHFTNNGTDISQLKALCQKLKPSALHHTDHLNEQVNAMANGVHNLIEHVSCVDTKNGGPNFVQSICYTQADGCAINYPLLNMTYDSPRHRTPSCMLGYMALATLHYTGLSAPAALALPDNEFMQRFIVPMCTSFTVCPESCVYSGDKTLDTKGNLDQSTEDFAMVLAHHYYTGIKDGYQSLGECLAEKSNHELREHIKAIQKNPRDNAKGHFLIADDCETLSGMIKSIDGGIHLASQKLAGGCDVKLGDHLWDSTRGLKNLEKVPKQDFHMAAQLLGRYSRLRANASKGKLPSAQIGLCIVSAKGASFKLGQSELNGHACTVAQTISAEGNANYCIGEGTTNLSMRNLPENCPQKVSLLLSNGERLCDTTEALAIIGQNMAELCSTGKGSSRLGQTIPCSFGGKDPYSACPFYMASFFMGLEMGQNIPGVIPLDARNNNNNNNHKHTKHTKHTGTLAADVVRPVQPPLFGAPVAGLSCENVRAIPINLGLAMGEDKAHQFLAGITNRNLESYPPRASKEKLMHLMSRWGDLQPLPKLAVEDNHWILSSAESFKCADLLRGVAECKTRLAKEFNALQAKDPHSDGVQMHVKQHMLSVVCQFHVPLPVSEKWMLSCAHNMRLAIKALPVADEGVCMQAQFAL